MRLSLYMALLGSLSPALAPAQTPPNASVFDSAGVRIRYVDRGSGDPVLLIHGFTGRLEFWETTGIAAGLTAAGFRVIAYDARGHGDSAKPHDPGEYGEEDGEDAVRLLDHLSIPRASVVGYSRGARIASQLVAQHPNRLRSVVFGGWGVDNPVDTLAREDCLAAADSLAGGVFPVLLAQALRPSGAPPPTTEEQAVIMRQLAAGNDMRALAAAFRADCRARRVTAAALRATGVPALAIVGAHDGMKPSVHVMDREMAGALEVIVIPHADHYTTPVHPEFTARLVAFLRDRHRESSAPPPLSPCTKEESPMVMTVLEARVATDRLGDVERVFREGTSVVPPELVETYLVRDTKDPSLFRLTTVWRSMADLQKMRQSGVKPKGVQMFEAVGATPTLSIFEVVLHRSN